MAKAEFFVKGYTNGKGEDRIEVLMAKETAVGLLQPEFKATRERLMKAIEAVVKEAKS